MVLNPIAYTKKVVRSFRRYQLTARPFADESVRWLSQTAGKWVEPILCNELLGTKCNGLGELSEGTLA